MKEYTTPARKAFLVFNYLFLTVTSLVCILPFIHLLAMSFSSSSAVAAGRVSFWPVEPTLAAYEFALKGGEFTQALWISIQRVVLGVAFVEFLMIITAYPMAISSQKLAGVYI